jgi:hypothetical protein
MTGVINAKSEALELHELSSEELDAVSGGSKAHQGGSDLNQRRNPSTRTGGTCVEAAAAREAAAAHTSRPPRRSASPSRTRCSAAPTRLSNKPPFVHSRCCTCSRPLVALSGGSQGGELRQLLGE